MSIKKAYVSTSAGQIHYSFTEGEGVPIICFHQTASSSRSFHKLMEVGDIKNPFFAFDTPGFGNSFDPKGMPKFEEFASWLMEAINSLGINQFHALGHHTGAAICVEIAKSYADKVLSMILVGPFPLTPEEREEFRPMFSKPIEPNKDGSYLIETWDYLRKLGADNDLQTHHEELIDHVRAYYSRYQTYSAVWDYDFTTPYKNVTCPILIMAADDDVLYPYLDRSRKLNSKAEFVESFGANYEPTLDSVNMSSQISKFLSSHSL